MLPERIESKIERIPFSDCWWWTASTNKDGYGRVGYEGSNRPAHRVVFELLRGNIGRLEIDHLCKNRACVNPAHLDPVDHLTNVKRSNCGYRKGMTVCFKGHPFTKESTYFAPDGSRSCRICSAGRMRGYRSSK